MGDQGSNASGLDSGIGMQQDIPISVTHFSPATNGYGVERETIFMDGGDESNPNVTSELDPASIVRKHLTNPFLTLVEEATAEPPNSDPVNPFKYNTIGRTNPFTNPNRSRNPFLDNTTDVPSSEELVNGGQLNGENRSPDASIDPTPILTPTPLEDLSKPTVNKIVSKKRTLHTHLLLFSVWIKKCFVL